MKQYTKWLSILVSLIICCCLPFLVHAQGDPGADPDVVVPVDGGISILAVAGVAYSVKKIKEYRKKKHEGNKAEQNLF